jgi:hypothetical protein
MPSSEVDIKFIVQIPQRGGENWRQYHQNLEDCLKRLDRQQRGPKRITHTASTALADMSGNGVVE